MHALQEARDVPVDRSSGGSGCQDVARGTKRSLLLLPRRVPAPFRIKGKAMKRHLLWLPLIGICLSMPAHAQISPFRGTKGTPLNSADIAALTDATNRLLDQPDLAVGSTENWSNPQSGGSGTVTAGKPLQRHGLGCRTMQYVVTFPKDTASRNRTLVWCKTQNGWKIG
jgi:surface antigen